MHTFLNRIVALLGGADRKIQLAAKPVEGRNLPVESPRRSRLGRFYAFVPPLQHVESHQVGVVRAQSGGPSASRWQFYRLDD